MTAAQIIEALAISAYRQTDLGATTPRPSSAGGAEDPVAFDLEAADAS